MAASGVSAAPLPWEPQLAEAFISYSYDSAEHRAWVGKLATDLTGMGIEVLLDVWELRLGQDTTKFMQAAISQSDRVLMICTEKYVARANDGKSGGVPFEGMIIRAELVENIDTIKFIPVIRDQDKAVRIPISWGIACMSIFGGRGIRCNGTRVGSRYL